MNASDRVAAMLGNAIDLTSIDASTPRPFIPGALRILRPGIRASLFGPRGGGKSLAALTLAEQIIDAGGTVAYLDLENGTPRTAERLSDILSDRPSQNRQAIKERLTYLPNVRFSKLTDELRAAWADTLGGYTLVIVDSVARALGQLGLNEDRAEDYARFTVDYADPLAHMGAAVVLLDNTGYEAKERTRGTSGKWDMLELAYLVTGGDRITHTKNGTIKLERKRSRDGDEATTLELSAGGGEYGRIEEKVSVQQLMAELVKYVSEHPGEDTKQISAAVHKRPATVGSLLRELAGTSQLETRECERSRPSGTSGNVVKYKGWFIAQPSQNNKFPTPGNPADSDSAGQPPDMKFPESPPYVVRGLGNSIECQPENKLADLELERLRRKGLAV